MAVYERSYRPFEGALTPKRTRFLVLPRYAYERVFKSRLFVAFLIVWFLWPLFLAFAIYLPHNVSVLEKLGTTTEELAFLPLFNQNADWFVFWFMLPQGFISFVTTLVVGPALISGDLRNNGLPLYLSRPFSRTEYILGKVSVLALLLSVISWIPGLLLFLLKAYFAGFGWLTENLRIGAAIFLASWIWIVVLCLLSLAFSAYLKWRPVAGLALLAVFFVASGFSGFVNLMLKTHWASLINISDMVKVVWSHLFQIDSKLSVPVWAAWISLLTLCACCLALLYRKVRAYEIVR
jgi:ABC-2 type transport system permease protein